MAKTAIRRIVVFVALAAMNTIVVCADEVKQPAASPTANPFITAPPLQTRTSNFYANFLAPRLDSRLQGQFAQALDYTNRAGNPWMQDHETVDRMERAAFRATKGAIKRYAVEQLGLDNWSVPLRGGGGQGLAAMRTESGGTRLRFGFAHRRPKAEMLIPVQSGRFAVSVDGRGNLGASFETNDWKFRINAGIEPSEHEATFGMVRRF